MKTLYICLSLVLSLLIGACTYGAEQCKCSDTASPAVKPGYGWPSTTHRYVSIDTATQRIKEDQAAAAIIILMSSNRKTNLDSDVLESVWMGQDLRSAVPLYLVDADKIPAPETAMIEKLLASPKGFAKPTCLYISNGKPRGFTVGERECTRTILGIKARRS